MNIYDVAKKSGVSIATVSRVLNGSGKVSEKTKKKVMDVMNAGNYAPNAFARGLGLNTMRMVGVLCANFSVDFYATAVGLIEKALRSCGFKVILCCTGYEVEDKKRCIAEMTNQGVDALILIGSIFCEEDDNSHIYEAAVHMPVILINGSLDFPNVYCVYCDETNLMKECVLSLAAKGYTRPAYLHTHYSYSDRYKLRGYREGLAAAGLVSDERLFVFCDSGTPETVAESMMELEEKSISYDSIIATNDFVAVAAQRYVNASVPVIGFNNSTLALCSSPTLTSMDNMLEMMCSVSISILTKLLNGDEDMPQRTCITGRIIYRESFPK